MIKPCACACGCRRKQAGNAGRYYQGQLDKFINPNWKNWEWIDIGMGVSKPMLLDPLPGIASNAASQIITEYTNDQAGKKPGDVK